jgi:hypothetical protein
MSLDDFERMEFDQLKFSSKTIGQLYPVLVDHHGNIIDGEHRLKANKNWKKIKLDHITTEKDRLLAKIISNNVRRNVSAREKNELLGMLGEIFLEKGVEPGQIAYKIAEESGMSYRWVIKYLPDEFKDKLQSDRNRFKTLRSGAYHASSINFVNPPKDFMKIISYKNTDFVTIIMKKSYFEKIEKNANNLGTTPINIIYNGIQLISRNKSYKEKESNTSTGIHNGKSLQPMMKPPMMKPPILNPVLNL